MTSWRAVAEELKAEGVRYAFGLPGEPKRLYDALVEFREQTRRHLGVPQ